MDLRSEPKRRDRLADLECVIFENIYEIVLAFFRCRFGWRDFYEGCNDGNGHLNRPHLGYVRFI